MDYAHVLKDLADVHFANARTIVLVQDNLNIHSKASLYEAFPCRRSFQAPGRLRMALHPKTRQLARSGGIRTRRPVVPSASTTIPDKQTLIEEVAAWEHDRNANKTKANWRLSNTQYSCSN